MLKYWDRFPIKMVDVSIKTKLCISCDVCCRFIDKDSPWAPLFLPHEINNKIARHLTKSGRVRLKDTGKIHICPFFKVESNKCSIYPKRPLDCRLYPFTISFDENRQNIILGMDTKCPFITEIKDKPFLKNHSRLIVNILEQKETASLIAQRSAFIGNYEADIIKLSTLNTLTKMVINNPEKKNFKSLQLKDKAVLDKFFKKFKNPHSSQSFINLYIWKHLHQIFWKKEKDSIEILVESGSDFLPLESFKKFKDYVYLSKDLAELRGNKYKHKRSSCNYFTKHYKYEYLPFNKLMKEECLNLFKKWRAKKKKGHKEDLCLRLSEDSYEAHKIAMENFKALGLAGRVIKIKGKICVYTFGFELAKDTFCILLEICDLKYKGISQFIFREFCRELAGYKYINTTDDSGIQNLRQTKLSYHPLF